uniref:Uncharacterized protein n=1 Tax=Arundo donax TaxID=35708 RepID=A0A0A9E1J2_ARUDO
MEAAESRGEKSRGGRCVGRGRGGVRVLVPCRGHGGDRGVRVGRLGHLDSCRELKEGWSEKCVGLAAGAAPKLLEMAAVSAVAPFLAKTFELVEDPATDGVVCRGTTRNSFVAWDSHAFAAGSSRAVSSTPTSPPSSSRSTPKSVITSIKCQCQSH